MGASDINEKTIVRIGVRKTVKKIIYQKNTEVKFNKEA